MRKFFENSILFFCSLSILISSSISPVHAMMAAAPGTGCYSREDIALGRVVLPLSEIIRLRRERKDTQIQKENKKEKLIRFFSFLGLLLPALISIIRFAGPIHCKINDTCDESTIAGVEVASFFYPLVGLLPIFIVMGNGELPRFWKSTIDLEAFDKILKNEEDFLRKVEHFYNTLNAYPVPQDAIDREIDAINLDKNFESIHAALIKHLTSFLSKRVVHTNQRYIREELLSNKIRANKEFMKAFYFYLGHVSHHAKGIYPYFDGEGKDEHLRSGGVIEVHSRHSSSIHVGKSSPSLEPQVNYELIAESLADILDIKVPNLLYQDRSEMLRSLPDVDRHGEVPAWAPLAVAAINQGHGLYTHVVIQP